MRSDFKFWYIKRDDDGFITEAAIRYYEGDYKQVIRQTPHGEVTSVEYVRSKKLKKADLPHVVNRATKKDTTESETFIYTPDDFGTIKSDDELTAFIKDELKKDPTREPINEQK